MTALRVLVCTGLACERSGAADVLRALDAATRDLDLLDRVTVGESRCRSRCEQAVAGAVFPGALPLASLRAEEAERTLHRIERMAGVPPTLPEPRPPVRSGLERYRRLAAGRARPTRRSLLRGWR